MISDYSGSRAKQCISDLVYKKAVNVIENITDSNKRTTELKIFQNEKGIIADLAWIYTRYGDWPICQRWRRSKSRPEQEGLNPGLILFVFRLGHLGNKGESEVRVMQDHTLLIKDWTDFIQVVLLVGLGWLLSGLRPWLQKTKTRKANFLAMKTEVSIWKRKAEQFKEEQIIGPLYRLPIINFWHSLMNLIASGFDKVDEIDRLSDFFINAKSLNHGLDNIDSFLRVGSKEDTDAITRENTRNRVYANEIIRLYPNVIEIINKNL